MAKLRGVGFLPNRNGWHFQGLVRNTEQQDRKEGAQRVEPEEQNQVVAHVTKHAPLTKGIGRRVLKNESSSRSSQRAAAGQQRCKCFDVPTSTVRRNISFDGGVPLDTCVRSHWLARKITHRDTSVASWHPIISNVGRTISCSREWGGEYMITTSPHHHRAYHKVSLTTNDTTKESIIPSVHTRHTRVVAAAAAHVTIL